MVVLAVAILVVCLLLFDKCNSKPDVVTYNGTDSLKQVIVEQTRVKDSLLIAVKKKDTLRVEVIKKYKVIKHDTIYANICAPIIKLCDSIILVDSSLITDLKHVIKVDSGIIANYKKVAEKLEVNPSKCLVIEDSYNGVIAGLAARMKVICIPEKTHIINSKLKLADFSFESMSDFYLEIKNN